MNGQTDGQSPALNTPKNTCKSEWTCVSWFNKISDTVASKAGRFIGYAVAAVVSVITFIPLLALDLGYVVKSLYDRRITKPQTPVQNLMPPSDSPTPVPNQASADDCKSPTLKHSTASSIQSQNATQKTPSPNLPVIPEAKVQWKRYIHDDDVKATMESYDHFFAKNIKHHPQEIPREAYHQLGKASEGSTPIDLITQDSLITVKLQKKFGGGGSKSFYDIGNDHALAMTACPHQPYDELMMLRYLEKLGIPTNEIKPAVIRWEFQGVKYTRATYIAPSFNSYAKQNAFVLDSKDADNVAKRLKGKKVLPEGQDPFIHENWDEIFNPLIRDVRTLVDNGFPVKGDAVNGILAGKGSKFHSGSGAKFEARAFPFDFSTKRHELEQLPQKKQLSIEEEREMLRAFIFEVVWVQFDIMAFNLPNKWITLIKELTERYLRKRS